MPLPSKSLGFAQHAIFIYVLLVIGIGLTGAVYYNNQKVAMKHDRQDDLTSIATLKVNEISRWRKERLDDSIVIMQNIFIVNAIHQWFEDPRQAEIKQGIQGWLESLDKNYDYADIILLDARGATRLSASHEAKEIESYTKGLAAEALRTGRIVFSDLYLEKSEKHIYIDILIPLFIRKGRDALPIGVLISRIDPHVFFYPLIQSWPRPTKTAETLIVRREGDEVLYLNELRYRKSTALRLRLPVDQRQLPAAMAARGTLGIVEGLDYRGGKVLAVIKKIPDTPWVLIAKIDEEEVYAVLRGLFWTVMLAMGSLIAIAGAVVGFIWHRQSTQFYQRQYEVELMHSSELREAEKKQSRLIGELANVNCELNDFAQIVSHDLKAPLRAIGTLARWLETDYSDRFDDRGRELVNLLMSRVNRLDEMIGCILKYSQVGRDKEDKTEVNLNDLVMNVIHLLAPPDHVKILIEGKLPMIVCQRTRIEQVFQNLLGNALKFMDKPAGEIRVGCEAEGDCWKFKVSDNGPGIERKDFKRIFHIFQTLKSSDESESTGVGLALVKKIVEMYGGKVWVESTVGKGSTFYFTLRKDEAQPLAD